MPSQQDFYILPTDQQDITAFVPETLPPSSRLTDGECSFCGGSGATKTCADCNGAPTSDGMNKIATCYCSIECQKNQWNEHEEVCKGHQARRSLYRAAGLAQKIFSVFRKTLFDLSIGLVATATGEMLVLEESNVGSVFTAFPEVLIKSESENNALLTHNACDDAVGYMHELLEKMLHGIHKTIVERFVIPKNKRYKVDVLRVDGQRDPTDLYHSVVIVKLRNGEWHIVDLAGAQYGFHESAMPMSQYHRDRISTYYHVFQFGHLGASLLQQLKEGNARERELNQTECRYTKCLNSAVQDWEEANMKLRDLVKLPEGGFGEIGNDFVNFIVNTLQAFKDGEQAQGTRGNDFHESDLANAGFDGAAVPSRM